MAPGAGSAMTQTILPPHLVEAWKAEYVSPVVAWMCHENFQESGKIFEAGGGYAGEVHWARTQGHHFDIDKGYDIDEVAKKWDNVRNRDKER
jgi:hypothetical protein